MADAFRLYNTSTDSGGLPIAAQEHLFQIVAHTQKTLVQPTEEAHFKICGFLSEEFTYSSQAVYDNLTTPQAPDNLLWKVFKDETQRSMATYGYLTKKTYSNSSSQSLTIKFRAVSHSTFKTCTVTPNYGDAAGENFTHPVVIAQSLMSLTMNTVGKTALFNFPSLAGTAIGAKAQNYFTTAMGLAADAANVFGAPVGLQFEKPKVTPDVSVTKAAADATSHPIDTLFVKNPLVVELTIGNIFKKDYMVVKNVDVTFSKEYFRQGEPLYADYTVTLESLFNSSNQEDPTKEIMFGTGLNYDRDTYIIEVTN